MAKLTINRGSSANDGSGDNLRVGAGKINDNFDEIYTALGDGTTITTSNFATLTGTQTLTNKTLTTPVIEEINGTTITLDSVGDIILDADNNGLVDFKDGGTTYLRVSEVGNDAILKSFISDGNFLIKGNDGGVDTTALTFDMSNAGAATFNDKVILGANKVIEFGDPGETIFGNGTNLNITSGNQTIIDSASTIFLDSNNGVVAYNTGATEYMRVSKSTNDAIIKSSISDGDFAIKGNDGGSEITALTLDMSNAGAATFNSTIAATGLTINSAYTFPTADGSANQVLQTDGSGNLSFATASGGATSIDELSDAVADSQNNINFGTNGIGSVYSSYTAASNIGVGNFSLQVMRYGSCNIAIGSSTMRNGGTSANFQGNTVIGDNSAFCLGTGSTGAANNTFVGLKAGCTVTSGCNNLILGANTTPSSATVSNEITLGDTNITSLRIPGLQSGATDGHVLTFCSANSNLVLKAAGGGATSLNGLSDVTYETTTENLGIGTNALDSLQVGSPYNPTGNIAIGFNAGTNVSIAGQNVLIGYNALCNGCNVGNNVAIGCDALKELPQGYCNTAIGAGALRCQTEQLGKNTALGAFAGGAITTGKNNTLIGIQTGWKLTTQCGNTMVGFCVNGYFQATGGDSNVMVGCAAGFCNQGSCNVYLGQWTAYNATTASQNTYVGSNAGQRNTTGGNNTAIGYFAGRCNETGTVNTSVGYHAGYEGRGNCNVYLGPYAGGTSSHTGNNNVLIGYQSTPSSTTVSNEITLGHTTHTALRANVTTISSLSDCRDKTEIQPISVGLCFVKDLNPVQFKWDRRDETMTDVKEVGFIAQELDEVQQKHNIEDHLNIVLKSNPDRLEASPGKLIPILVKAIQELTKKIEDIESKIGV